MAKVERFEDLIAWQKARALRREIQKASLASVFRKDLELRSRIRRAALSVMSNIAEGFERGTRAEFAHFLATSKASCGEVAFAALRGVRR
jgi:four helix bundle protein